MDPMSALALLNFTLGVAKLLGPGGPSLGDLLGVQVQMLKVLSEQMLALQAGMIAVLKRLDGIQRLLEALPAEIVRENHVEHVAGCLGTYQQIMEAGALEAATGISARQALLNNHLKGEVLDKLVDSCSVLLNHPNMTLAPLLGVALHAQVSGMISLYVHESDGPIGIPPERAPYEKAYIRTLLLRYQRCFREVLARTVESLAVGRKDRDGLLHELMGLHATDMCISHYDDYDVSNGFRRDTVKVKWGRVVRNIPVEPSLAYELDPDMALASETTRKDIRALLTSGVVTVADLPQDEYYDSVCEIKDVVASIDHDPLSDVPGEPTSSDPAIIEAKRGVIWKLIHTCRRCSDREIFFELKAKESDLEQRLDSIGYKAISLASAQIASKAALQIIAKFLADPALNDR
jgi:hypothetical protein